jgi:hypothetical protein
MADGKEPYNVPFSAFNFLQVMMNFLRMETLTCDTSRQKKTLYFTWNLSLLHNIRNSYKSKVL